MRELAVWEFDIYALSRKRGHAFGNASPAGAWINDDGATLAIALKEVGREAYGYTLMRRRTDSVWTEGPDFMGHSSLAEVRRAVETQVLGEQETVPVPSGIPARAPLHDLGGRTPSDVFARLSNRSHHPAAWALNQLYLALDRPDKNWASDCQTGNFHTRIWEAQLNASLREQGMLVTQPFESPDFRIETRAGEVAWIEAVTANPPVPYNHLNAKPIEIPTEREQLSFGPAALRFAKTLGNKLDRKYDQLSHVGSSPLMIAIADFHAPASMTWSREGLVGYLYGLGAQEEVIDGVRRAVATRSRHVLGHPDFPTGLFADDRHAELSAVIFSNAATIAKLYRVPISAHGAPEGLRYSRIGMFFDRAPGALRGIPFCFDITSQKYRELWPHGYEPWTAELEVFHNPYAKHPASLELLPEATHWFEHDGELMCSSVYEHSILWSSTLITNLDKPAPSLADFERVTQSEE